ncbi:MAG TPA: glycoside hydrolase, partial [Thermoanaerobaculia bacterium]|nr:glycoside hydrolase [Thermoanaerobaculia bacterium]
GNVPWYWIRPQHALSGGQGMHRFVWDLHYPPFPPKTPSYPIAAVPRDTAPDYSSPWVLPGTYTLRLTAGATTRTQPLVVQMDPRVKTSRADLEKQFALSMRVYELLQKSTDDARTEKLRTLLDILQNADAAPAAQVVRAVEEMEK